MEYNISPSPFIWAVGIENTFIPQARVRFRPLDEFTLTQHYELWREDLDRVASLGVSHLRWGPPWYQVQPEPNSFDWRWTDQVLETLVCQKNITPILDLVHYGTPFWLERSFDDPDYPAYVADYTAAFAERYRSLVRCYTPLNEPLITAEFCGKLGQWPPYFTDERGQTRLILQLVRGQQLAMQRLRAIVPGCTLVAVEALNWHYTRQAELQPLLDQWLDARFLSFDLVTGQLTPQQHSYRYLVAQGSSEAEIEQILAQAQLFDWFGVNFYPWSGGEVSLTSKGTYRVNRRSLTGRHLEPLLQLAYQKSRLPLLVTETSAKSNVAGRTRWMAETLAAVGRSQTAGLPVIGYTWFPVFSMIDWRYRLDRRPLSKHLLHLGLWDCQLDETGILQRHETPLVAEYRSYLHHKGL
ncbi:MAG: family 1 glycosylhydrolase [Anaerolineae bacterium]|nr:family 1 glycosylhydrolase [Anaerolineae bacterium]